MKIDVDKINSIDLQGFIVSAAGVYDRTPVRSVLVCGGRAEILVCNLSLEGDTVCLTIASQEQSADGIAIVEVVSKFTDWLLEVFEKVVIRNKCNICLSINSDFYKADKVYIKYRNRPNMCFECCWYDASMDRCNYKPESVDTNYSSVACSMFNTQDTKNKT